MSDDSINVDNFEIWSECPHLDTLPAEIEVRRGNGLVSFVDKVARTAATFSFNEGDFKLSFDQFRDRIWSPVARNFNILRDNKGLERLPI